MYAASLNTENVPVPLRSSAELYELHAEAQVGLVATEATHCLVPCHLLKLGRQLYATNLLEQVACHNPQRG